MSDQVGQQLSEDRKKKNQSAVGRLQSLISTFLARKLQTHGDPGYMLTQSTQFVSDILVKMILPCINVDIYS